MGSVSHVEKERNELVKDGHRLARLGVCLINLSNICVIVQNRVESSLVVEVKDIQDRHLILLEFKGAVHNQRVELFSHGGDGVLHYRVDCILDVGELRNHNLIKSHNSIHPYAKKMYHNLREDYWWKGMKTDIVIFVSM